MALPVTGKVLLDTNVFIDYLRAELYADWLFGGDLKLNSEASLMTLEDSSSNDCSDC